MSAVVVWLVVGIVTALEVIVVELHRMVSLCEVEVVVDMDRATDIAFRQKLS